MSIEHKMRREDGAGKTVGVSGADLVPGTYLKTRTGIVRGEELFSRPDLERPWRTGVVQKHATAIALKEKEIEELLKLCSDLRTQLGNAHSDIRFVEFAVTEQSRAQLAERDGTIVELQGKVAALTKEMSELKDSTEHQLRLAKSQHENEQLALKTEARLAAERCAQLAKEFQRQLEDVKAAAAREVEYVESRYSAKVAELIAELKAVREAGKAAEAHFVMQCTEAKNTLARVESDYKERLRAAEARLDELRHTSEEALQRERSGKETALADSRKAAEQLAAALADRDEVLQRYKLWNNYILSALDTFYQAFVAAVPESAVDPVDPEIHQIPYLYAPRVALEEPEAKLIVERIVYRLLQLKMIKRFRTSGDDGDDGRGGAKKELPSDQQLTQLADRQGRLKKAIRETEDKCNEAEAALTSALSRLYFFSDNLEGSVSGGAAMVDEVPLLAHPPLRNVVFVCLSIPNGAVLWTDDTASMRTAVSLLSSTVRLKMGEYGAYECYSDDVSMLLAFGDAAAACRFCTESQEWLTRVPWPPELLRSVLCKEERSTNYDRHVVFRGLRVSMAMHCGEAFVEPTAILLTNGSYRCHYYGRAVSQLIHMAALAQGGQVIISKPAWQLCLRKRHELGQLVVTDLGAFPIVAYNSQTGTQEKQTLQLLQALPQSLRERTFRSTSKMEIPAVSALSGVRQSILSTEIEVLAERRSALKEAIGLLQEEFHSVHAEMASLTVRTRGARAHFHLLPPPEMVSQMNDLYSVMEKVAVRAEEIRADIRHLEISLEELDVQSKGLKDYLREHAITESREDELRTEIEVTGLRNDQLMREIVEKHRRDNDKLRGTLQEREQTIRRLCQTLDVGANVGGQQTASSGGYRGGRI